MREHEADRREMPIPLLEDFHNPLHSIDADPVPGFEPHGRIATANHGGNAHLTRDDGRMREHRAHICYNSCMDASNKKAAFTPPIVLMIYATV